MCTCVFTKHSPRLTEWASAVCCYNGKARSYSDSSVTWMSTVAYSAPRISTRTRGMKERSTTIICHWTRYWFSSISCSVFTWERSESRELLFGPGQIWGTIKMLKSNWIAECSTQAHCCPRNMYDWIKISDFTKKCIFRFRITLDQVVRRALLQHGTERWGSLEGWVADGLSAPRERLWGT